MNLYCAICGQRFEPDDRHVWVEAETRDIDARDEKEEYALHAECWQRLSDGWMEPA